MILDFIQISSFSLIDKTKSSGAARDSSDDSSSDEDNEKMETDDHHNSLNQVRFCEIHFKVSAILHKI